MVSYGDRYMPLSKANILDKVNQFEIFSCYCAPFKKLYKTFKSELRQDQNPTCSICKKGDQLIYKDFAESGTLDCFGYIMVKYCVNFGEALEMINQDFQLGLSSGIKLTNTRAVTANRIYFNIDEEPDSVIDIRVCVRNWTLSDKEFWNGKYYLKSSTLDYFNVYPLSGFFINGIYTKCGSNVYGYYFGKFPDGREAWKIYQPYADKRIKWRSNCPEDVIQGWNQLCEQDDFCVITKSLKDTMVLWEIGIPSVAPQAESHTISPELVTELKKRFKHILLLYDNDEPGKKAAAKMAEQHNIPVFFMPEFSKDASDFVELYGQEELLHYVTEHYETHCNNS